MNLSFGDSNHIIKKSEEPTRLNHPRHVAEISHKGLKTFRVIKDLDEYVINKKIETQFAVWDEKWSKIVEKNKNEYEESASLELAKYKTVLARKAIEDIEDILNHTLKIDDTINWDGLKDDSAFNIENPKYKILEEINDLEHSFSDIRKPKEPRKEYYEPDFELLDILFKPLKKKKINQAEEQWQKRLAEWDSDLAEYEKKKNNFEVNKDLLEKKADELEKKWEQEKIDFYKNQEEANKNLDNFQKLYLDQDPNAILEYCELVLYNSIYPENFPKNFDLEYNPETKIIIVEYMLPSPDNIPNLLEVKYIASTKELKEVYLSEVQKAKLFDDTVYKIALRTIHELLESDKSDSIDAVIFNGWVNDINRATGKMITSCIVSIEAKKSEFLEIDLSNIDPKLCFKNLKGIGSSKLSGIIAIQPIAQINKNDRRFIEPQDVAYKLNEGSNIATMDWQEFEHLIREIFAQEFQSGGGEVKVTQASRDGGVDAVAFDPDPIRGGKIIIQAKRYINTVGVAAVRDLYGTVVNEGAIKGILVTTSDYGPDAYEFTKNKPLTLINGANLLFLLHKHGHKARIDIPEARRLSNYHDTQ